MVIGLRAFLRAGGAMAPCNLRPTVYSGQDDLDNRKIMPTTCLTGRYVVGGSMPASQAFAIAQSVRLARLARAGAAIVLRRRSGRHVAGRCGAGAFRSAM